MGSVKLAPTFAEVTPRDQPWLWEGFIPKELVTPVIAPPKASKTTLLEDIISRVSRGDAMPDGKPGVAASPVLFVSAEDSADTSVVHKLIAARANLYNVINVSDGADGDGFLLDQKNVDWLAAQMSLRPGVELVVIDTLTKTATKSISSGPALKAMMRPLHNLAKKTGAAVVIPTHTRKDGEYAGAKELISDPRHILCVEKGTNDPTVRTLKVYASNIWDGDSDGISYRLVGDGAKMRVEYLWQGNNPGGTGPNPTGQAKILALLRQYRRPMSLREIADRTGVPYGSAAVLLSRMVKKGELAHDQKLYSSMATAAAASKTDAA